jgi:hypothetical protein
MSKILFASIVGCLIVCGTTARAQKPWLKMCEAGAAQTTLPDNATVGICQGQANAAHAATYALGCQNPDDPGLIMFTKPFGTTAPAPAPSTPLWTGNITDAGRYADEYMGCARTWGATR